MRIAPSLFIVPLLLAPLLADASDSQKDLRRGTDGSAVPHIPEPMVFDLVRGLGAEKGELEANTLGVSDLANPGDIHWAPEIEYAVLDWVALELELPMSNTTLEAIKFAGQLTFGAPGTRWVHGAQGIVEVLLSGGTEMTGLYLYGVHLGGPFTMLGMSGVRFHEQALQRRIDMLQNTSLFAQVSDGLALGLETNLSHAKGRALDLLLMPQVHARLLPHIVLQGGVGAGRHKGALTPHAGARLIIER